MIELGGNIKLDGFETVEPGKLVVAKKMIGNYVKKISDKFSDFKEITVSLDGDTVRVRLSLESGEKESNGSGNNLFFAIDAALGGFLK